MDSHIVQQPKANCLGNRFRLIKFFFCGLGGCGVVTLGQFEKFKMATNVTENQPIFLNLMKNKTSNTNKMLFNTFSN